MISNFRLVSLGIVAEHKKPSTHIAKVHPAELLSEIDGVLQSIPVEFYSSGVHADESEYSIKIEADTAFECEWLPFEEHRLTSPDIRRGEQVLIWQMGDEDKYYWSSFGRDRNLRRLETVIWAFSNISDPEADVDGLTPDNAYYIEVSTHKKHITIRTNKNDGEPFSYTIQLNTGDGNYTVMDDVGNYVQLDSKNTMIDLTNKEGTHLRLDKKDIYGFAPNNMYMKAVNDMRFECTNFVLKAKDVLVDAPKTKFTGDVEVEKGVKVGAELDVDKGITSGGVVDSQGFTAPKGVWHKH